MIDCHLQVTEESHWQGDYITLSHRWGEGSFMALNSSNLEDFKNQIPKNSMPKVFLDTFSFALAMGVKYLWIDSLSIVQDSLEDWRDVCPKMRSIYSNALFNIAAASNRSTSDNGAGLFTRRSSSLIQPCLVQHKFPVLPSSHREWSTNTTLVLIDQQLFEGAVNRCALYSRAWVLQERLLAPRVLHFSQEQLFWECREMVACEAFVEGLPNGLDLHLNPWSEKAMVLLHQQSNQEIKEIWRSLIQNYTRKQLSHRKDRLPAIEGLARLYGDYRNEAYLDGLWEGDLMYQMLWAVYPPGGKYNGAVLDRRGPSWSWSSIEAPVSPLGSDWRNNQPNLYLADIHQSHIESKTVNFMGEILSGTIRLSAWICRLEEVLILETGEGIYLIPGTNYTFDKEMKETLTGSLYLSHRLADVCPSAVGNLIIPDDIRSFDSTTHVFP
jgi:Heterokaryon incompatibility protein (HET)